MKEKTLNLFRFTPEGKIVHALSSGEKSFSQLVEATELSERWLSIKLKRLLQLGVVKATTEGYQVDHERLHAVLTPSMKEIAWMAAYEILEKHPQILSVVLYGSVAKGDTHGESDIDLLVISENPLDFTEDEYEVSMKYGVAFEITSMPLREFLALLHFESGLLFGILEGYHVFFDRAGITALLKVAMKDVQKEWRYKEGEELWVKVEK